MKFGFRFVKPGPLAVVLVTLMIVGALVINSWFLMLVLGAAGHVFNIPVLHQIGFFEALGLTVLVEVLRQVFAG